MLDEQAGGVVSATERLFRSKYAELRSSLAAYFREQMHAAQVGTESNERKRLERLKKVIYGLADDEYNKEISKATEDLTEALKRYVK